MKSRKAQRRLPSYTLFLILGDFLALVGAFVGAYILRVKIDERPLIEAIPARTYLEIFLYILPFWLLIFAVLGLYQRSLIHRRFRELGLLLLGSFLGLLFVIGYDFVVDTPVFPARLVPVYGFALAFGFLVIFRSLARSVRFYLFSRGAWLKRVMVVGSGKLTDTLLEDLNHAAGYEVAVLVGDKRILRKHKGKLYASIEEAIEKVNPDQIDEIIQTEMHQNDAINDQLLSFAQSNHLGYRFTPSNSDLLVGNIEVELLNSYIPIVTVEPTPLLGWGSIVKRAFDIFVSTLLLILLSPLLLILYVAVKLSDVSSSAMFRQDRLSLHGSVVRIYKFRSHKSEFHGLTPEQAFEKMGKPELSKKYRAGGDQLVSDPRVSRIGQFIRKFSLDELPQLINVLLGDISLVGPRALVPEELDEYPDKHLILSVKSGITGLAQVSGRGDISFEKRRQLDVYYVRNWTFTGDLMILLRTARIAINGRGARS